MVQVDTEDNFDPLDRDGVRGLPTLLVFKGGQRVDWTSGSPSKAELGRAAGRALLEQFRRVRGGAPTSSGQELTVKLSRQ